MVRGEHDAGYRSLVMEPDGDRSFVARLDAWRERGDVVHFYLQAFDSAGNALARNGEALNPFVARARESKGAPPLMTSAGSWKHPIWIAAALLIVTFVLGSRLRARTGRRIPEPARPRPEARRAAAAPYLQAALDRIENDIFWYLLLSPLVHLPESELEPRLVALAAKTHRHPTRGECRFDLRKIRLRLLWLRQVDERELLARRNSLRKQAGHDAASPPAGYMMIELLVVVALVAVILGASWFAMRRTESPLRTGGEIVEGMLERARAGALSSLDVRRVRPFDDRSLVLESGSSCTSGTWSLEGGSRTELPRGVHLSATGWSVCFNSRGIPSANQTIPLQHETDGTQSLEVLRGGVVRWQ
jgi:Tfp pilus assembly protein FimT